MSGTETKPGTNFEREIALLLERLGYEVDHDVKLTGESVEHQIDILAKRGSLGGEETIVVECKDWKNAVGKNVAMKVLEIVDDLKPKVDKGMLITTSRFTSGTEEYVRNKPIDLIDGARLDMLIEGEGEGELNRKIADWVKRAGVEAEIPITSVDSAMEVASIYLNDFFGKEYGFEVTGAELKGSKWSIDFKSEYEKSKKTGKGKAKIDKDSGKIIGIRETKKPEKAQACFIATASLGSPLHPKLDILRSFRDEKLLSNPLGESLVKLYYRVSPPFAEVISNSENLRKVCRNILIEPIVDFLEG